MVLVSRFCELNPEITFDLDIDVAWSKGQAPLQQGVADVALRATDDVSGETLIIKKLARIPLGVYCSLKYHQKYGAPRTIEEARVHKFLAYSDEVGQVMRAVNWLNAQMGEDQVLYQVNAVASMIAALQTSQALGLLPCVSADATADLVLCFRHEELYHTLWMVASNESYGRPAVRKFMAFAGEQFGPGGFENAE